MKKLAIIVMAIAALMLTACANTAANAAANADAEDTTAPEEKTVSGIVTDATMNTITIQAEDGSEYSFSLNEDTETVYREGLREGIQVTINYTQNTGNADAERKVIRITETGDGEEGTEETDFVEMASKIQKAVADKDLEALADLCSFPMYVDIENGMEIDSREAFLELGTDAIFTDRLQEVIEGTDPAELTKVSAGIVMSDDEGITNITFSADADGNLKITGINY